MISSHTFLSLPHYLLVSFTCALEHLVLFCWSLSVSSFLFSLFLSPLDWIISVDPFLSLLIFFFLPSSICREIHPLKFSFSYCFSLSEFPFCSFFSFVFLLRHCVHTLKSMCSSQFLSIFSFNPLYKIAALKSVC